LSNLHLLVYQSYMQCMHDFCQYPQLVELLQRKRLSSKTQILAIGKAAWKMASLSARVLAEKGLGYSGFVLTKAGLAHGEIPGLKILEGGHPLLNEQSLESSQIIVDWLQKLPAEDDLLVLISGGSSAMFELPAQGLTLPELILKNKELLASGLNIAQMNSERRKLSRLKGGRAFELCRSRRVLVFAVSDVAEDDPRVIGSGPFTPSSELSETERGWLFKTGGRTLEYRVVANNLDFRRLLGKNLGKHGFRVLIDEAYESDELSKLRTKIRGTLRQTQKLRPGSRMPFMLLLGGETPVKVTGSGKGGRCSHLALSLSRYLARLENSALFCFATDGCDNIPGSGGAWVDSNSWNLFKKEEIHPPDAIRDFDSHSALKAINHLLPAPLLTTNVNDVFLLSHGYNLEYPCANDCSEELDIFHDLP